MENMETTQTIIISRDGVIKQEFKNQKDDLKAFGWMLRNQPHSIDHALRYEGYEVKLINDQTGEIDFYKPYIRH